MVEDPGLRQDGSGIDHEVAQQRELGRRQGDQLPVLPHLVGVVVELYVGKRDSRILRRLLTETSAPQQHSQTRHHLFETERLGDVVVSPDGQPGDLVFQGIAGRQKQRGRLHTVGPEATQQAEPVHPRHHDVQDEGIGPKGPGTVDGTRAVRRCPDVEPLELQRHRQQFENVRFIVYHQHSCTLITHGTYSADPYF